MKYEGLLKTSETLFRVKAVLADLVAAAEETNKQMYLVDNPAEAPGREERKNERYYEGQSWAGMHEYPFTGEDSEAFDLAYNNLKTAVERAKKELKIK